MREQEEFFRERGLELEVIKLRKEDKEEQWLHNIIQKFYIVAVNSFGRWLPYSAIDSRTRVSDMILLLKDKMGEVVGYGVNEIRELNGVKVNCFSSGFVRRELQGEGIYCRMNDVRFEMLPTAEAILTRTQNPIVYRKFVELGRKHGFCMSPCENAARDTTGELAHTYFYHPESNPLKITSTARELALAYGPDMRDDMVVEGVYNFPEEGIGGRALMYDTPRPSTEIERIIWGSLQIDKGDAVIIVGHK